MRSDNCNGARRKVNPSIGCFSWLAIVAVNDDRSWRSSLSWVERGTGTWGVLNNNRSVSNSWKKNELTRRPICLGYQGKNPLRIWILSCMRHALLQLRNSLQCFDRSSTTHYVKSCVRDGMERFYFDWLDGLYLGYWLCPLWHENQTKHPANSRVCPYPVRIAL